MGPAGAESGLGSIFHKAIDHALEALQTQTVFTAHLASVLRTMALEGSGIVRLPKSLVGDDIAAGDLVTAATEAWNVELEIRVYRSHPQLGRAVEALWDTSVQSVKGTPAEQKASIPDDRSR